MHVIVQETEALMAYEQLEVPVSLGGQRFLDLVSSLPEGTVADYLAAEATAANPSATLAGLEQSDVESARDSSDEGDDDEYSPTSGGGTSVWGSGRARRSAQQRSSAASSGASMRLHRRALGPIGGTLISRTAFRSLYHFTVVEPLGMSPAYLEFFDRKALLVFCLLESRLGRETLLQVGSERLLSKILNLKLAF